MTKSKLMEYVGKKVYVYFKNEDSGIYGTLGYVNDYSRTGYFFIGYTSFKASHVRKLVETDARKLVEVESEG